MVPLYVPHYIVFYDPSHLKVVHSVGQRNDEARVVVDGFVTEDNVHAVIQVSKVVLCRGQLTGVIFWVVPVKQTI